MPFCKNCGSSIEDGAKFCENCGTPIEAPVAQPAPQPAPQPVQAQPVQSQSTTQYQSSQVPEGTNGFCIAGFICALATVLMGVGLVPALILSIVGLVQVKKSGQKGKGFAIAGIIIPIAVMLIATICVILYFVFIIAGAAIASTY